MYRIQLIIATATLLISLNIFAQNHEKIIIYDNDSSENSFDAIWSAIHLENYIYTIGTSDTDAAYERMWIGKANTTGQMILKRYYGENGVYPTTIKSIDNHTIVVAGQWHGVGGFVLIYDTQLNLIKEKVYQFPIVDFFVNTEGKIVIASSSSVYWLHDDLSIEISSTIDDSDYFISSINESETGGILVFGEAHCCPDNPELPTNYFGQGDLFLLEISSAGEINWVKLYGGSGYEWAYVEEDYGRKSQLLKTTDGNYLFTAETDSEDGDVDEFFGADDIWVIKVNPEGEILWKRSLGLKSTDAPTSIVEINNGYLVGGLLFSWNLSDDMLECDTCRARIAWAGLLNPNDGQLINQIWIDGEEDELFTDFLEIDNKLYGFGWTTSWEGDFTDLKEDDQDAFMVVFNENVISNFVSLSPSTLSFGLSYFGDQIYIYCPDCDDTYDLQIYSSDGILAFTDKIVLKDNYIISPASNLFGQYFVVLSNKEASGIRSIFLN